jgi:hypothetical protein
MLGWSVDLPGAFICKSVGMARRLKVTIGQSRALHRMTTPIPPFQEPSRQDTINQYNLLFLKKIVKTPLSASFRGGFRVRSRFFFSSQHFVNLSDVFTSRA